VTAVHQFVPVLAGRDAIGRHTFAARDLMRAAGYESEIYAEELRPELLGQARPIEDLPRRDDSWLLYQCSTGSELGSHLADHGEAVIVNYHNITPAELFMPWEPLVGREMLKAREQLATVAPKARGALAVSSYNAAELVALDCPHVEVAPILLDLTDLDEAPDRNTADRLERYKATTGGSDWLFVGRIAPNKAQHDLVLALAAYRETFDPNARLWLVGSSSSHHYQTRIGDLIDDLGLKDAVHLVGSSSPAELIAYYAAADVFVSVSDHEGFCVPVLEAMHCRVPVAAYHAGAIPETLAGAGLCLSSKRPLDVASAVGRVLGDAPLREAMVARGTARAHDLGLARSGPRFLAALERVMAA
jgi:glycosyltransferase involved in cell wall biosynthesis